MQDNGYLHPECWEVLQVTAWVPLLDATPSNGCMQVIKRGHMPGKTVKHSCCVGGTWCVC
jgi:ectoine hydroxylase-related dioxygenase (phytanoyl-CoA dioxygenase family)